MTSATQSLTALFAADERHRAALVLPEDSRTLSLADLEAAVVRLAGQLRSLGIQRGDRVALVLPPGRAFLEVLFAVLAVGAAAAPLNPAYTKDEYDFYLHDLEATLLLLPDDTLHAPRAAAAPTIAIVDVVEDEPTTLVADGRPVESKAPFEVGGPEDIALLLHTSGTTSRPKQVPLLQRNLMASARAIANHYRLTPEDVSYAAMPLFHVHGLVASVLAALYAGGSIVVPRRFTPHRFWSHARAHGVTWFSAGPTLHQMMLEKIDAEGAPRSLRFVRSCSSALSPALMQRLERTLGVPVLEAYGMTEASHQMASNPLPPARRVPGSVGVATGTEIRIVDPTGRVLAQRTPGEVVIRGPGVTPGYLNNPRGNAEAFVDGWFRTGDRGVFENGYLRLEGRLKEMIIRGGENISPYEIEEVLRGHPAVDDVACFGVADELYGEKVGAAVVLKRHAGNRDLGNYCRERLATYKVPELIRVVDKIPRTPTGKVQRKRLAAALFPDGR
jgi:oxalate---CoA ligase